ncbi:hypothetical protein MicloDRAFT_00006210 [Microvirga lotononidis]|uniref:Uncharacterized protein n=1 Tax=Microvirga lotononidis TaxID=864069 RepID=I4Z3C6_9HYPH|nr:hypothetical protein MicloDRAFT_00006210 [Microvirga lotononidis]
MSTILTSGHLFIMQNSDAEKRLDLLKEALAADEIIPLSRPGAPAAQLRGTACTAHAGRHRRGTQHAGASPVQDPHQYGVGRAVHRTAPASSDASSLDGRAIGGAGGTDRPPRWLATCRGPSSSTAGTMAPCARPWQKPAEGTSRYKASRGRRKSATFGRKPTICLEGNSNPDQRQRQSSPYASRQYEAGRKLPRHRFRLCRSPDQNRYSDADPWRGEGMAPQPWPFLRRLPLR